MSVIHPLRPLASALAAVPSRRWRQAAAALGLAGAAAATPLVFNALTPTAVVAAPTPAPVVARASGMPDFADLVEAVGPSVVNIRTMERGVSARAPFPGMPPGGIDPNLEEFFRRFGIPLPGGRGMPQPPRGGQGEDDGPAQQRGVGSGFILSSDGLIMTNAHVVDGADELIVTLTDKREFKAKVIGLDKRTDVAVVKIDAAGLPAVRMGDVGKLRVGEWVLAIGSPFNLDNTVTAGIVSAKARDTGDYLPFIQTDVAVNPGNSGGPLINMRGEVVGINSQIYSRSGGFMGISFAIPIDEASRVAEQLRAHGKVVRGRIGVSIAPVTKEVAESIGLGKAMGAMVRGVEAGLPADKAGIEAGDIITKVDGKPVDKASDLQRYIGETKPGSKATVQVFRRGQYRDLTVAVAEFEPDTVRAASSSGGGDEPAAGSRSALGVTVADLTEAQRRQLKVKGGARVTAVEGAGARAGLREGDIILTVDNTEIQSAQQFASVAAKADKARAVSVMVRRGDWVNYLVIRPNAR